MFKHLRIKRKIQALLLLEAIALCAVGWFAVSQSFHIYDKNMYDEVSDRFSLYTVLLDDALGKIESLSFTISFNEEIQRLLATIKERQGTMEALIAGKELENKLVNYPSSSTFIDSIELLPLGAMQYSAGAKTLTYSYEERVAIETMAGQHSGGHTWADSLDRSNALYSVRQIRMTEHLSLEPVGTLVIRINMDKLLQGSVASIHDFGSKLILLSGNKTLYPEKTGYDLEKLHQSLPKRNGYRITALDGDKLMIISETFPPKGWTIVCLIPYESLFRHIVQMKIFMAVLFIIILLVLMYVGLKVAVSLTKPIEKLTAKMAATGKGYFDLETDEPPPNRDEIGMLNRDFDKMVRKIDALIKETYLKQLLLKETEYRALQAKINPHFLYNTFESINWLAIANGQKQISCMIKALGDLLRSSISDKPIISLGEELLVLDNYITIQKIRFGNKLAYHQEVPTELRECQIPSFILQPLVENAIVHGVEESTDLCEIVVTGSRYDNHLTLSVRDTGPGVSEQTVAAFACGNKVGSGTGIGLGNIDARIKMMFGDSFGIVMERVPSGGTEVSLRVPFLKGGGINDQSIDRG